MHVSTSGWNSALAAQLCSECTGPTRHSSTPPPPAYRRGILLAAAWPPLVAAHGALPAASRGRICLLEQATVAHDQLVQGCTAILHHGGSGTVAAAIAAGVPHIVAPLQFDQYFWAERLEHLGLAPAPLGADWWRLLERSADIGSSEATGGAPRNSAVETATAVQHKRAAAALSARLQQAVRDPALRMRCAELAMTVATQVFGLERACKIAVGAL